MARTQPRQKNSGKHSKQLVLIAMVIITVIVTVVILAVANIPGEITILDGSTSMKVTTNEKDPQKIIAEKGIKLGKYDVLDASQFGMQNSVLIIKREMSVVFCESGSSSWRVTLPARTVNDVLAYLSIEPGEGDVVEPAGFEIISEGDVITLYRAGTATLTVDGESKSVVTNNKTVLQILAENNVILGKDDTVEPSLDTVVEKGEEIRVIRVTFKELTEKEPVKYKTAKQEDASMAKGTQKVIQKGKNGTKEVTYSVRYENGEPAEKTIVSEKVLTKPVKKIVRVGTAVSSVAKNGQTKTVKSEKDLKYTAKYTGIASAYYEPAGNMTASGMKVGVGRIGVNPKIIPYGTKLYVTGYGYCVAADCGWGTTGMGRIADLYFNSEAECEAWGLRTVTMYVLE